MNADELKLLEMQRLFFPHLPIWEYSVRRQGWQRVWQARNFAFRQDTNYRIQEHKPTTYPRSGRVIPGAT